MKVIIAGSRNIDDLELIYDAHTGSGFAIEDITEIVSGTALGVDKLGEKFAYEQNKEVVRFPADWERYGKAAGPIRNEKMARYADALIAVSLDNSRGTTNMIQNMVKLNKPVYVYYVTKYNGMLDRKFSRQGEEIINYEVELINGERRYISGIQEHRPVSTDTESKSNV